MNQRPSALDAARAVDEAEAHIAYDFREVEAEEVENGLRAIVAANQGQHQHEAQRQRQEAAEAAREQLLDDAMADVDEIVRRHRTRLGRKVCSRHDGATIRKIWGLLRSMHGADVSADDDSAFGER
jgi:hypothetical protein